MKNVTENNRFIMLDNGYTVPQKLYESVKELVTEINPALLPEVKYTLEMLCGPEYWASLSDGERRQAGKCMAFTVRRHLVPYVSAGKSCQSPKVYSPV